ncbi:hypothetical protein ASZ90_007322 [hydrocarbon metagenome]|uniref:Glycosyltransferase RgtA/B/C/D-like domain-containing protein n=1 Tax=hydrocarbon metagenome TaxID=938273 RepID=A0A0W8FPP5_9ZZZZ
MNSVTNKDISASKLSSIRLPFLSQITPILIYFVIVSLFFSRFSQDMSVDGVSYVEIARLYLAGNWQEAVNGFWSPLISWLLVPLLACKLSPDIAFKIITISAGLIALFANGALVSQCVKNRNLSLIVQCAAAVMIASFALLVCTPDILGLAFSLLFIVALITSLRTKRFSWIFTAGVLLVISYFAKTFFLPFGICIAVMFPSAGFALHHSLDRFRYDIRNTILICCIAAVLVMPWVIAIHAKYGEWTIGTAGKLNFDLVVKQENITQLIASKTVISPFQDPTRFALSSRTKIDYHAIIINLSHNLTALAIRTVRHYPLAVISVMLAFFTIYHSRKLYWQNAFILGLPVLLLWTAYSTVCAFVPQQTYLWLGDVLLLVIMAVGLEQSGVIGLCRNRIARATITLFILLLWTSYPIAEMIVRNAQGVSEKESGISLKKYVEGKTVVSDSLTGNSLVACFWASAKYRGRYPDNLYLENIENADYFLRWNEQTIMPQGFKRVANIKLALGPVDIWKKLAD